VTIHLPGVPDDEVIGIIPAGELTETLGIVVDVPIIAARAFDERQTCRFVHDYLEGRIDGRLDDFTGCTSYRAHDCRCAGAGHRALCLFHEVETSAAWRLARQWRRVTIDGGATALCRREHVSAGLAGACGGVLHA
jgi:hypothetical protein